MSFSFASLLSRCLSLSLCLSVSLLAERPTDRSVCLSFKCYPKGCAAPGFVPCQCNARECLSKLEATSPHRKIHVTSKPPVGGISAVTLIRTDTTLDHSQKAEKVCFFTQSDQMAEQDCLRRVMCECDFMVCKGARLGRPMYGALLIHTAHHASSTAGRMLTSC